MIDPSQWDAENIKTWLDWMTERFELSPAPTFSLFPQTGAELVELSKAEFCVCALSEASGKLLAEYIGWKIYDATGRRRMSLDDRKDPGEKKKNIYRKCRVFLQKKITQP